MVFTICIDNGYKIYIGFFDRRNKSEKSENKQTRKENTKLCAERSLNGRTNAGEYPDGIGRRDGYNYK